MLKRIRKAIIGVCVLSALGVLATAAPAAVVVNLFPSASTVGLGSDFEVDVVIFGLEDVDLAAYGIDVGFNDDALDYEDISFGEGLGWPDDSVEDVDDTAEGVVSVAETSLLFDFSGQPDAFTLFTLTFSTQAIGSSDFELLRIDLSDPDTNAIDASNSGDVNVVPIPAAAWLLGTGLLGLVGLRRRQRKAA
jgi:hypothetical protein